MKRTPLLRPKHPALVHLLAALGLATFGAMMVTHPAAAERTVTEEEQAQITTLAGQYQQDAGLLTWLVRHGYELADLTNLLGYARQFGRPLGELVALKKFPGADEGAAGQEMKNLFTQAGQWSQEAEQVWTRNDRAWTWEEVKNMLARRASGRVDLPTLVHYGRFMNWNEIDTALGYVSLYGRSLGELEEFRRQMDWTEIQALLDNEKAWGVAADQLRRLRVELTWDDLLKVHQLATRHGCTFDQVVTLRRRETADTLTNLLGLATQYEKPVEQVLALYEKTGDPAEVVTLFKNAADWKVPVEELARDRETLRWTDLTQAQSLVTTYGVPFAEAVRLLQETTPDEATAVLKNARDWNQDYRLLESLRRYLTWTDLGQAVQEAKQAAWSLEEVLALRRLAGQPTADGLAEAQKALADYGQGGKQREALQGLTRRPLEWSDIQNVRARYQQGLADLPTLVGLRQRWTWGDIDQILNLARQYRQPPTVIADLGHTREWAEVTNLLQRAQQWGVEVETARQWREEVTWADLDTAVQHANQYRVPQARLLELRRTHHWTVITGLLNVSQQYGLPLDTLLELHQTRDLTEITNLASYAQTWKVPLTDLVKHREQLSWADLTAVQKLAGQYAQPLGPLVALRRQNTLEELTQALANAKAWNLDLQQVLQWRRWLTWPELTQAIALANKHAIAVDDVLAHRRNGLWWKEVEKALQP